MRDFRIAGLIVLLSVVPACGERLVEFATSTPDAGAVDAPSNSADANTADANTVDADIADAGNPDAGNPDAGNPDTGNPDVTPSLLTVVSTNPMPNATGVSINKVITATFSSPMNASTITDASFIVRQGLIGVAGVVDYDALTNTARFKPNAPLDVGKVYEATITTGAATPSGTTLAMDHKWSFTTGACSLPKIDLGSASSYAILAFSAVSSTGAVGTIVNGDIGLFPKTATDFTGFPPGIHVGTLNAANTAAELAMGDLTKAYNKAALLSLCAITVTPQDLGGTTKTPGLYRSDSSLEITTGDLTLDAQGDADAVFVFQMPSSTLTVANDRKVILSGNAKAENVYWQVGSSATLGTDVVFHGTILADVSITVGTRTKVDGRLLARTAAVTLDTNAVTSPR